MDNIPVTFEYNGKQYAGHFHPVSGTANNTSFQLIVGGYYFGNLRYTARGWVFDSSFIPTMADFFGDYLTAWYDSHY